MLSKKLERLARETKRQQRLARRAARQRAKAAAAAPAAAAPADVEAPAPAGPPTGAAEAAPKPAVEEEAAAAAAPELQGFGGALKRLLGDPQVAGWGGCGCWHPVEKRAQGVLAAAPGLLRCLQHSPPAAPLATRHETWIHSLSPLGYPRQSLAFRTTSPPCCLPAPAVCPQVVTFFALCTVLGFGHGIIGGFLFMFLAEHGAWAPRACVLDDAAPLLHGSAELPAGSASNQLHGQLAQFHAAAAMDLPSPPKQPAISGHLRPSAGGGELLMGAVLTANSLPELPAFFFFGARHAHLRLLPPPGQPYPAVTTILCCLAPLCPSRRLPGGLPTRPCCHPAGAIMQALGMQTLLLSAAAALGLRIWAYSVGVVCQQPCGCTCRHWGVVWEAEVGKTALQPTLPFLAPSSCPSASEQPPLRHPSLTLACSCCPPWACATSCFWRRCTRSPTPAAGAAAPSTAPRLRPRGWRAPRRRGRAGQGRGSWLVAAAGLIIWTSGAMGLREASARGSFPCLRSGTGSDRPGLCAAAPPADSPPSPRLLYRTTSKLSPPPLCPLPRHARPVPGAVRRRGQGAGKQKAGCGVDAPFCRPTLPLFSRLPTHRQGLFQGLWTGVGCGLAGLLGERRAKGNPGGGAACWAAPHMLWRGGAGVEREGERRAHCRQTLQRLIPLYSATPAETVCFFVLTTVLLALPGGILYGSHGPIVLFRVSGRWRWAAAGPHRTRMQSCVVHFATAGQRPDTIPAPSLPHPRLSALPTRRPPRLRPGDPRVHRRGGRPHAGGAPSSQGSRGTGPAAQPRVAGRPGVAGAVSRLARPRLLPLCCGNHDGVVRPHGSLSRPVSSPLVP